MANIETIDPGYVQQVQDKLNWGLKSDLTTLTSLIGRENVRGLEKMAAIAQYLPSTRSVTKRGVGFFQGDLMGTQILPEVEINPNGTEVASYPIFGKEALYGGGDDSVQISGDVKRADLGLTWASATMVLHGKKAYIDPRETRAAGASVIDLMAAKTELIRGQVETRKETIIANLLTNTASYASASYFQVLAGGTMWSNAASTPIPVITSMLETIRQGMGVYPTHFWFSPTAFRALRFHAAITALIQYSGTPKNPGAPVSEQTLGAIFNLNIVVGRGVSITTPGGALTDVWNNCAGLAFVNEADLYAPQLGMTLRDPAYPKTISYRVEESGGEGSDAIKYIDLYVPVITLNSAGALWTNVN